MKWLYCYKKQVKDIENCPIDIKCEMFAPGIRSGYTLPGESCSFKQICLRLLFRIITHGKAKIVFVANDDDLMHTSYVIPKCSKFPFWGKEDYEIGPCFTLPKYRGKGIYPAVLRYICKNIGSEKSVFYMIVDESNQPSIKGIEKAGFVRCGTVRTTKLTKKYILE